MKRIQLVLNNTMRLIAKSCLRDKESVQSLVKKTNLPTVNQMVVESTLIETWKSINFNLPVAKYLQPHQDHVQTRAAGKHLLQIPQLKNNHEEWFLWKSPRIWNDLPVELRMETKFKLAKQAAKKIAKERAFM